MISRLPATFGVPRSGGACLATCSAHIWTRDNLSLAKAGSMILQTDNTIQCSVQRDPHILFYTVGARIVWQKKRPRRKCMPWMLCASHRNGCREGRYSVAEAANESPFGVYPKRRWRSR